MNWPALAIAATPFLTRILGGGDSSRDVTQRTEIPQWLTDLYLKQMGIANNVYGGHPSSFLSLYGGGKPQNMNLSQFLLPRR